MMFEVCKRKDIKYENIESLVLFWLSKVVLRTSNSEIKTKFRKLERVSCKLIREQAHLSFNEHCIQHKLLPIFTNIKLYDAAVKPKDFVKDFRVQLVEHEISQHKQNIRELARERLTSVDELQSACQSTQRFRACITFLQKIEGKLTAELTEKHNRKLCNICGSNVYLKMTYYLHLILVILQ